MRNIYGQPGSKRFCSGYGKPGSPQTGFEYGYLLAPDSMPKMQESAATSCGSTQLAGLPQPGQRWLLHGRRLTDRLGWYDNDAEYVIQGDAVADFGKVVASPWTAKERQYPRVIVPPTTRPTVCHIRRRRCACRATTGIKPTFSRRRAFRHP